MSDGDERTVDGDDRPSADGGTPAEESGTDPGAGRPEPPEPPRSPDPAGAGGDPLPAPDRVARYIQWATLAAFLLLGVVAGVGLYTSAGRVIQVWVASRYQPVVRTVFNAALLLVAAGGSAGVLRRLD